jgi:phosphoribosyl-ATP pyrophosphohydrolase
VIVPSIDLMGGKAVQLRRGEPGAKALERDDVDALAERFARVGELAVIDLDAALGRGSNRALVERLCRRFRCRVGGGIRTVEAGRELLQAGAERIIIGTAATPELLRQFKPEQVIVAVDEKGGEVVAEGWTRGTGARVLDRVRALEPFCSGFLYTAVEREGMLGGAALDGIRALRAATQRTVTAAGGIASVDEARAIVEMGCEVQLGMSIYTGRIEVEELFAAIADFGNGLVHEGHRLLPTLVEDDEGELLMLAWSSPESLVLALREGRGVYWSRSRGALWRKGEESGHVQRLLAARLDCDRDAIRFTVRQQGPACHTGQDTCWGRRRPRLGATEGVLRERLERPTGSFASKLMADERLIRRKLHEESWEVQDASDERATLHEAADLLFFATALLVKRGLGWADVLKVLRGRERP